MKDVLQTRLGQNCITHLITKFNLYCWIWIQCCLCSMIPYLAPSLCITVVITISTWQGPNTGCGYILPTGVLQQTVADYHRITFTHYVWKGSSLIQQLIAIAQVMIIPAQTAFYNYSKQNTPWSIKNKTPNYCPCLRQILTDFQNSFTGTLSMKFAIKISLQILPHLNGVATLPCEILVHKNRIDWKHSNGRRDVCIVKRMRLR